MSVLIGQTLAGRFDDEFSSDQLEDLSLRRMSLDEYDRLVEMGFFDEDERIELLDGIVVELEPVNASHADSSLSKDRNRKSELYARTGIKEYWIVNLIDDQLEVYREPDIKPNRKGFYHSRTIYLPGQMVVPLAFPTCEMNVATMIPEAGSDDL